MFALVQDGSITKHLSGNKGVTIGDIQYPRNIFTLWSAEEKEAIGIYEIVHNNNNKRDEAFYTNTNVSYAFADGVVTASYGSATAKSLADVTDEDDNVSLGLKSQKKEIIKQQASGLLTPTDWYIIKAVDVESYSAPANIVTYRANIRTASNDMETIIDNASDVDALATLYQYVNTGTEEEPVMERPLGEFPEAV